MHREKENKSQRILFLTTTIKEGAGGIASVNRAIVATLGSYPESLRPQLKVMQLHGEFEGNRLAFVREFMKTLLVWHPTFILIDHLHLAPLGLFGRQITKVPYALFCHGTEFDDKLGSLRTHALKKASLRIANSRFTASRLQKRYPDIAFQPCLLGIDPGITNPKPESLAVIPNALGLNTGVADNAVLIVGRMLSTEKYKGHEELLRALVWVLKIVPNAQLVIAGSGDDTARLAKLACDLGIGASGLFTGWVKTENLAWLFAKCKLFAMPSRHEGFGLTYAEAMRYGKPVIASNCDGGSEVVQNGTTGLLVDPNDIHDIAKRTIQLLTDESLNQKMGQAGYARYQQFFSHQAFALRLKETLASYLPQTEIKSRKAA